MARTDGTHLVWMRGAGEEVGAGRRERYELWASPFATRPDALVPRRIDRLDVPDINNAIGVGNGWAWTSEWADEEGGDVVYVLRHLERGERRVYRVPEGEHPGTADPLTAPEELAVPVRTSPGRLSLTSLRFVRYDALPEEPPAE